MKKGVYIINVSRGTIVNNKDLLEALKSGYIAGAALDVYSNEIVYVNKDIKNEVLEDNIIEEFFTMDNVIITPHSAFYTDEALSNMVSISVNNILEFKNTGKCLNEI
ncbi:NAD(P)-dependent oxidoreductase [Brachyspira pulli]